MEVAHFACRSSSRFSKSRGSEPGTQLRPPTSAHTDATWGGLGVFGLLLFAWFSLFATIPDGIAEVGRKASTPFRVETFSPSGIVRAVRQVVATFSADVVPFADPRVGSAPFVVTCAEQGKGRWIDSRTRSFDFARDLPSGIECSFEASPHLVSLTGARLEGERTFAFSSGGPAIAMVSPLGGSTIAEDNLFLVATTGAVDMKSIAESVWFEAEGIVERIPVQVEDPADFAGLVRSNFGADFRQTVVVLRARRHFPASRRVRLVWSGAVQSPNGIRNDSSQTIEYQVRPDLSLRILCEISNRRGDCAPDGPLRIDFSSPVPTHLAKQLRLVGPKDVVREPENVDSSNVVDRVVFRGPLPPQSELVLKVPPDFQDEIGRRPVLPQPGQVPVRIGPVSPLLTFPSSFGVIERASPALLPMTVRRMKSFRHEGVHEGVTDDTTKTGFIPTRGRIAKVENPQEILTWLYHVKRNQSSGGKSIFLEGTGLSSTPIELPAVSGEGEVIGLPLPGPGFFVVEFERTSQGAAGLDELPPGSGPVFVRTAALVTNLGAHLKVGRESGLVWVTALDSGAPVHDAAVTVQDCLGREVYAGRTGSDGRLTLPGLPTLSDSLCRERPPAYIASVQMGDDLSFVLSTWRQGLEPWRFNLFTTYRDAGLAAHTIFAQSLVRRGETVQMKHVLRARTGEGYDQVSETSRPSIARILHRGTSESFDLPLTWRSNGTAELSWPVARDAKLGTYAVLLVRLMPGGTGQDSEEVVESGTFDVDVYRVPLVRGSLDASSHDSVGSDDIELTATVHYLAGGPARDLPVTFRYTTGGHSVDFGKEWAGYTFAGGPVTAGRHTYSYDGNEGTTTQPGVVEQVGTLDETGAARFRVADLPHSPSVFELRGELEFRDPMGEIRTAPRSVTVWPAAIALGIRSTSPLPRGEVALNIVALSPKGVALSGVPVTLTEFRRISYGNRKRLVGGFYGHEYVQEIRPSRVFCEGRTDASGMLHCRGVAREPGSLIYEARTTDERGRVAATSTSVWVPGDDDEWFEGSSSDRIDLVPEKTEWSPGETARIQVRSPFSRATALISVEREGVLRSLVREIVRGDSVIEVPIESGDIPNVFVSVLLVRGRVGEIQPTPFVDLGKPAFKYGVVELTVNRAENVLDVDVIPEQTVLEPRGRAKVVVAVRRADGTPPPAGTEVSIAVVDEGALEIQPNLSWNIVAAMLGRRPYGVITATGQSYIVGKRHFGLKARPTGGGGGRQITRELFDTLLFWRGAVPLDSSGRAEIDFPLNDALTSFRVVAVALGGKSLFGHGSAVIRSHQDLQVFAGIPPVVRVGDAFLAEYTVRNASSAPMSLVAALRGAGENVADQVVELAPQTSQVVQWQVQSPEPGERKFRFTVREGDALRDSLETMQRVVPVLTPKVMQSTIAQIEPEITVPVAIPVGADPRIGGIRVGLLRSLGEGLEPMVRRMEEYPYTCLEQRVSRAVVLRDRALWQEMMADLPGLVDHRGLFRFFPNVTLGDGLLTSYVLNIAAQSGFEVPESMRERALVGLAHFVRRTGDFAEMPSTSTESRISRIAALEALAVYGRATPEDVAAIAVDPTTLDTESLISWLVILMSVTKDRDKDGAIRTVIANLRARLNVQGTQAMLTDTNVVGPLWWRLSSLDLQFLRLFEVVQRFGLWAELAPRLSRSAIERQKGGAWDLTNANAWGRIAFDRFASRFEASPVQGSTTVTFGDRREKLRWDSSRLSVELPWSDREQPLTVVHEGKGAPWLQLDAVALLPLTEPIQSGYTIKRTVVPLQGAKSGAWRVGDIARVRLEIEAQADRTWVVVDDPVPAGATALGGAKPEGLAGQGVSSGSERPVHEERSETGYRAYFDYLPQGRTVVEYTVRFNTPGTYHLSNTRVEAMYSPEMFGEIPHAAVVIEK